MLCYVIVAPVCVLNAPVVVAKLCFDGGLLFTWFLGESENGCLCTLLTLVELLEDFHGSIIDQSHYKALQKVASV